MVDRLEELGVTILFAIGLVGVIAAEYGHNGVSGGVGTMEGRETRFGISASALWAQFTTVASNGSVNSMHDSYSPLGGMIPMIGMAHGTAGAVASAAAGTVLSGAGGMASSVKAKSEVALDYKLFAAGNATPVVADAPKLKAKSDGEDVITPLVVQASTAILADVMKKK